MKKIADMTVDEIKQEMLTYKCDKNRGYAFISYSHRDCEKVYPLVLSWMRAGYNIYIDLDFARHGSDSNWVGLMTKTLANRLCRLAVCFGSVHYTYSYASLLELLTMRGKKVNGLHGEKLAVDYYVLGEIPMGCDDIREEYRAIYEHYFYNLKNDMGATFLAQNKKERESLQRGMEYWLSQKGCPLKGDTAEEWLENLEDAYEAGYLNFFPTVAGLVKKWIVSQGLNTNCYSLDTEVWIQQERFRCQGVDRSEGAAAFAGSEMAREDEAEVQAGDAEQKARQAGESERGARQAEAAWEPERGIAQAEPARESEGETAQTEPASEPGQGAGQAEAAWESGRGAGQVEPAGEPKQGAKSDDELEGRIQSAELHIGKVEKGSEADKPVAEIKQEVESDRLLLETMEKMQKTAESGEGVISAEEECPEALCALARSYDFGEGVEQDYTKAVIFYRKAAAAGALFAQSRLGVLYEEGLGVEQNIPKAVKCYRRAAHNGDGFAEFRLGCCYEKGKGVVRDAVKAVEHYRKAAKQGIVDAQLTMARCYKEGMGVEPSPEKAVKCYKRVASKGNAQALFLLGRCYQDGYGVERSDEKATVCYRKAAAQGYEEARAVLESSMAGWR